MAAGSTPHHIRLTCPDCGHVQSEPGMVVATACRACGANFQVRDGQVVVRPKSAAHFHFRAASSQGPARFPSIGSAGPSVYPKPPPPARGFLQRLFRKAPKVRTVVCFDCHRTHSVVPHAVSSQCPACSAYISLKNHTITEPWNRRIQTRGDVIIEKRGSISGVPIACHNLTVSGELAAAVECSGTLTILSHGKIPGTVRCHTLRVARGAKVEFLHAVEAASVFVDGHLTGRIHCTGAVVLERRAVLQGLVRAARLNVKPGAKHVGAVEIIRPAASEDQAPARG